MAEAPKDNPVTPPIEDMHWAVSYLREDIHDLRQESRGQIHDVRQEIGEFRKELIQRIDGAVHRLRRELSARFYWMIGLLFASWLSTMGTLLYKL